MIVGSLPIGVGAEVMGAIELTHVLDLVVFEVYLFLGHYKRWQSGFDEVIEEFLGDVEITLGYVGDSLGHFEEIYSEVWM